jgi:hypothetical protein
MPYDQKLERPDGRRWGRRLRRRDGRRRSQLSWVFEIFHQEGIERSDIVIASARLTIDGLILVLRGHSDQAITVRREDSRSGREDDIRATAREWLRLLG